MLLQDMEFELIPAREDARQAGVENWLAVGSAMNQADFSCGYSVRSCLE